MDTDGQTIGGLLLWIVPPIIGCLAGASELVARYKDEPFKAIRSIPAGSYIVLNGIASLVAIFMIERFGWTFGVAEVWPQIIVKILVAGFGAMALFRSSFFNVRVGETDVGVGPSSLLTIVLEAIDRQVDRQRAEVRAVVASRIMEGVSFGKAKLALPMTCFAMMQNVPVAEQERTSSEINEIQNAETSDHARAIGLGLTLMNSVGEDVLKAAVKALGEHIKRPEQEESEVEGHESNDFSQNNAPT
jgi:hypothetical protein